MSEPTAKSLYETFDKFNVPTPERAEFIAIVESTKPDIVLPATNPN